MSNDVDPFDDFAACQDFVESYEFDTHTGDVQQQERESSASEESSQRTTSSHNSTKRVKRTQDEIRIAKNERRNAANKRRRALIMSQLKRPAVNQPTEAPEAFPSFDNSDSLAYLPVSLVQHMNCGDFSAVRSALAAHVSPRCTANYDDQSISVDTFVDIFESFQDMYPDVILFMREGKVVDETISATLLTKYTETSYLYENVIDRLHHKFPLCFPKLSRRDRWMHAMHSKAFTVQDVLNAVALIDQRKSLVVQGKLEWTFTFSGARRKITHISSVWELTSLASVPDVVGDVRSPL